MNPYEFCLHVWGDRACFTRPDMKGEPVSYDVMTPSAARGVLEAILWKKAIRWEVFRIDVLKPIHTDTITTNAVKSVLALRTVKKAMQGKDVNLSINVSDTDHVRTQRTMRFLRDVGYRIHARLHMTDQAGERDNPKKFAAMFRRRARRGQCFQQPYLGCREFSAYFELITDLENAPAAIEESRDLGWMLYDRNYTLDEPTPRVFHARMDRGTVLVPAIDSPEIIG